jgi:hypothetical protein
LVRYRQDPEESQVVDRINLGISSAYTL